MKKRKVRICRTTAGGATYATCLPEDASPEVLAALDALADATVRLMERDEFAKEEIRSTAR